VQRQRKDEVDMECFRLEEQMQPDSAETRFTSTDMGASGPGTRSTEEFRIGFWRWGAETVLKNDPSKWKRESVNGRVMRPTRARQGGSRGDTSRRGRGNEKCPKIATRGNGRIDARYMETNPIHFGVLDHRGYQTLAEFANLRQLRQVARNQDPARDYHAFFSLWIDWAKIHRRRGRTDLLYPSTLFSHRSPFTAHFATIFNFRRPTIPHPSMNLYHYTPSTSLDPHLLLES
jgi:hypothetical protein